MTPRRRAALALLHRARRSRPTPFEQPALETRRQDLERRVVEARRRRHGVGRDGLRSRARPALHRRRQRLAVEPATTAAPAAATICILSSIVALRSRHRRIRLALPDDARRELGLHRHPAHHARRPRRSAGAPAQGADAGAEERLLLRARPRDRRADLGRALRATSTGRPTSTWTTGRPIETRGARYGRAAALRLARRRRGAQLAPDGVQPATGLVYMPATETYMAYAVDKTFPLRPAGRTTLRGNDGARGDRRIRRHSHRRRLLAWDPGAQREVWRVAIRVRQQRRALDRRQPGVPGHDAATFAAYRADTGKGSGRERSTSA